MKKIITLLLLFTLVFICLGVKQAGAVYSVNGPIGFGECPANSYHDSITSPCKCNSGYVDAGEGITSPNCILLNSSCHSQLGVSSSYNFVNNKCVCNNGYAIGASGQCINVDNYCLEQLGKMSQYDTSTSKCECESGYEFNGSTCIQKIVEPTVPSVNNDTSTSSLATTTVSQSMNICQFINILINIGVISSDKASTARLVFNCSI